MELQQFKFNVRELGISFLSVHIAADFSRHTIFDISRDDVFICGTFNAFDFVQRKAENFLQSRIGHGGFRTHADSNLLLFKCF